MLPPISSTLRRHVVWLGVILLFLPKINLISLGGETAGIRADDLILFWIMGLLVLSSLLALRRLSPISNVEKAAFWVIGLMLLSNVFNMLIYGQSNILYSIRLLEYFVFFYIGYYFALSRDIEGVLWGILIANGVVIILQMLGAVGGFTSEGYGPIGDRAIGLTAGPWEVGALINFIFAILIFNRDRSTWFVLKLFVVTMVLLLLTGARMPTLAQLVLLLAYFLHKTHNKFSVVLKLTAIGIPCLIALVTIPNPVLERSENLLNIAGNVDLLTGALERIDPVPTATIDEPDTESTEESDASWGMRAIKWAIAIKLYINSTASWLLGIGPGRLWTAVDGGWIRIFTENGIIGFFVFISLLRKISGINYGMKGLIIAFSISMLMIDIYMSYKAMSLVLFITGYMICKNVELRDDRVRAEELATIPQVT